MNIVEMRLKTAQAVAAANGDTNSVAVFDQLITDLQAVKHDPYILPDVIVPPTQPADPQAAHDAAMAAGPAPEQVTESPVTTDVGAPTPASSSADSGTLADGSVPADPATVQPVTPDPTSSAPAVDASAPASSVPDAAPVAPAASDAAPQPAAEQPAADPTPVIVQVSVPGPDSVPNAAAPVAASLPADEPVDPTPPESQTIDTLDARLDALEGHPRKVSRQ